MYKIFMLLSWSVFLGALFSVAGIVLSWVPAAYADLYGGLSDAIEHYVEFEKSNLDQANDKCSLLNPFNENYEMEQKVAKRNLVVMQLNVTRAEENRALLKSLKERKLTADSVLKTFLENRFKYIDGRVQAFERLQQHLASPSLDPSSKVATSMATHPDFVKQFDPDSAEYAEIQVVIDRYQNLNRLIKKTFLFTEYLSPPVKKMLQASVSIHPYLKGITDDPGYPEQSFYTPSGEKGECKDYALWDSYINPRVKILLPGGTLGAPGGAVSALLTLNEALEFKYITGNVECNLPSFNEVFPEKVAVEAEAEAAAYGNGAASPLAVVQPLATAQPGNVAALATGIGAGAQAMPMSEPAKVPPGVQSSWAVQVEVQPVSAHVPSKSVSKATDEKTTSFYLPARGKRVFHSKNMAVVEERSDLLGRLSSTQLQWLSHLFHHQVPSVKYRDFYAIWVRLNGKDSIVDSESGGSHKKLLDSEGNPVGDGIFARNMSQEYSKPYFKYLIDAFVGLGITKKMLK